VQAARRLQRSPGFTLLAILTLALGIGVEAALVSPITTVTAEPGGGRALDDVYVVERQAAARRTPPYFLAIDEVPIGLFHALQAAPRELVSHVAASTSGMIPLVQSGRRAARLPLTCATAEYPAVFDARLEAGRWFSEDDDLAARPVAVISDRVWRQWFNANPAIVNQATVRALHSTFTIIGVAPPGLTGADLWIPFGASKLLAPPLTPERQATWDAMTKYVVISVRRQAGALEERLTRFVDNAVTSGGGFGEPTLTTKLVSSTTLRGSLNLAARRAWMLSFVSLILIGACANLANMFYARGLARETEIAVRLSLGADRVRIARLFLAETTLVAAAAAVIGAGLAIVALRVLEAAMPVLGNNPAMRADAPVADVRVVLVALAAGFFSAMLVGLMTAWRATRVTQQRVLASAGAGATMTDGRLRTALVAIQITAAVVLVIVTGLYLENAPSVPDIRLGFDTAHVVAGRLFPDVRDDIRTGHEAFFDRVLNAARTLPGIQGAALATSLPGGVGPAAPRVVTLTLENTTGFANVVPRGITGNYSAVTPGFLRAIDLPLLRGRDFAPSDAAGEPRVGILSRSAAEVLFPGEDALGKHVEFNKGLMTTIVGISADPVTADSESKLVQPSNYILVPLAQWYSPDVLLAFRSTAPGAAIDAVSEAVHEIDPDAAILDPATLDQSLYAWYGPRRAGQVMMTLIGALALGIALLGVYGVITYFVTARTREFGIRLALGATPMRIVKLVVDHAIHIVLIGLLSGVFVASVTTRVVEARMFGTMPNGMTTWVVVPILILLTGVAAGYLPARRASRVDPNVSLRE
jgi:predicted permease